MRFLRITENEMNYGIKYQTPIVMGLKRSRRPSHRKFHLLKKENSK